MSTSAGTELTTFTNSLGVTFIQFAMGHQVEELNWRDYEEMKQIMQGTLNKNSTPNFIVEN